MILIFLFVFALVVLFRVRKVLKSEEVMEQWQKEDLREVRYLVIYPIIYLVLNIFSLSIDWTSPSKKKRLFWFFITFTFSHLRSVERSLLWHLCLIQTLVRGWPIPDHCSI